MDKAENISVCSYLQTMMITTICLLILNDFESLPLLSDTLLRRLE